MGRLSSLTSSEGTIDYRYEYDLNDHLIEVEDQKNGTTTYRSYDRFGEILSEKQASGFEIAYSYDELHRLAVVDFFDRKIVYSYSPAALVTATLCRDDKPLYCYRQECDLRGKLVENGLFNCAIRYRWDKDGRLTSLTSPHFSEEYRYDLVGNMIGKSGTDPKGIYESHFAYDDLYQLIEESGLFSHRYGYDSLFNRRKIDGEEVAVDALNQVTSNQGTAYEYDDIGRRIAQGDRRYRYDALGRLLSISGPDGDIAFTYDPFGRRISKTDKDGQSTYLYQGDAEIGLMEDRLKELRAIFGKRSTFAIELDGKPYFPIRNHRGDIVVIIDADGKAAAAVRYDSFGNADGDLTSPWLFCGQRWEAGFYHFDKRDYDPKLGVWISPDPAGFVDGPNLYAYVKNHPLCYVDPYGLFWAEAKDFSLGFGHGFASGVTLGASSWALGHYQPTSSYGEWGSYAGLGASIITPTGLEGACARTGVKVTQVAYKAFKSEGMAAKAVLHQKNLSTLSRGISNSAKESAVASKTLQSTAKSPYTGPHTEKLRFTLDQLSEAGKVMDRGGLTRAGRALDKHGGRANSAFPKAKGNSLEKSIQGQYHLDDILTDPRGYSKPNNFGGIDYFRSNHSGVRFYENGSLRGFLEPNL